MRSLRRQECERWQRRLSAYLDGALGTSAMREIAKHLETCQDCSAALDELRALKVALAQMPTPQPRPGFWPCIYAAVEGEALRQSRLCRRGWPERVSEWAGAHLRVIRQAAAVAAAAAVIISLAVSTLWWRPPADGLDDLIARHAEHSVQHPLGDQSRMVFVSCEVQAANRN